MSIGEWLTLASVLIVGIGVILNQRKSSDDLSRVFAERIATLEALVSTFQAHMNNFEKRMERRMDDFHDRLLEIEKEQRRDKSQR